MSFEILPTPLFERELKKLSKRHISLPQDFANIIALLVKDPYTGESLGTNCFKIRMAISSKNKGKSGGARIITYIKVVDQKVFLISIYDKSDTGTISNKELSDRIKDL